MHGNASPVDARSQVIPIRSTSRKDRTCINSTFAYVVTVLPSLENGLIDPTIDNHTMQMPQTYQKAVYTSASAICALQGSHPRNPFVSAVCDADTMMLFDTRSMAHPWV